MRPTYSWIRFFGTATLASMLLVGIAVSCGDDDVQSNNNSGSPDAAAQPDATAQPDAAAQPDATAQPDAAALTDASIPSGHTENNGGHFHMPGKEDPLANCTSCHGSNLRGGAGPSCYDCHNNSDHTINRLGQMHLSGSSTTCSTCHGPSNSGGLGPACSSCH